MDLKQLNVLIAIAETGSFSAAAGALHTVQSNVSSHIARLEAELDATLVDRATGSLTDEGQAVLARARRIQAEVDGLTTEVASMHDEVAGTTSLGLIGSTARWLVPHLLGVMEERHPRVRVLIVDATTTSLVPRLVVGQLDLALVVLPLNEHGVDVDPLFEEDHILVVPDDHELHGRKRVQLAELEAYPLLLAAPGTAFRDIVDRGAREAGVTLQAQAEIDGLRLLASLAFQGFGAAIVPASAAPGWVAGTWDRIELEGIEGRTVGLARRHRVLLSAPARALSEALHDVIDREAPHQAGIRPSPG